MFQNTKLLIVFSLFIIIAGISLLWFGLNPSTQTVLKKPVPAPTSDAQISDSPKSPEPSVSSLEGNRAFVTKVVDGDTIVVLINGEKHTIRILGVDTPETVDPRKSVQCFGKEASNETKKLLSGKEVILQKDVSNTDKYKRLLRFVYLPLEDGNLLFIDDYLIREGYAKVLTIPPDVKYSEQFLEAQREARMEKRGLWGKC